MEIRISERNLQTIHRQQGHGGVADMNPAFSLRAFLSRKAATHVQPLQVRSTHHWTLMKANNLKRGTKTIAITIKSRLQRVTRRETSSG